VIFLGLDFGEVRIGVAKSDPMGIIVQPLAVIEAKDQAKALDGIRRLVEEEHIDKIIVGLPKKLNGTFSQTTQRVLEWVSYLQKNLAVPVETWDERLSSKEAERVLLEGDLSRRKRKQHIDKISAQIILKSYLDANLPQQGADGDA